MWVGANSCWQVGWVRWGSSLNPHNDLFTEIKKDKERGERKHGQYKTFKHQVSLCTVTPPLPPSPSPPGSFDTPLSHLSTSLPPHQLPTPKILGQCMANRGQRSTGEPEKDRAGGEMLWVEHVCIYPVGDYMLQHSCIYFLAWCVLACVCFETI